MNTQSRLEHILLSMTGATAAGIFAEQVVPLLVQSWLDDYALRSPTRNVVETTLGHFSYLYDIENQRLIAAWGISQGRFAGTRDKARMARHPLGADRRYHRGHAIPHRLGGATDINLVPQLGAINLGAFRKLEREAVMGPGCLYYTYWKYPNGDSQRPLGVEQGLLRAGQPLKIRLHGN